MALSAHWCFVDREFMISGLPNRPLYGPETDALTDESPIDLVVPATAEGVQRDDDGRKQVADLLIFIDETVAAVAYAGDEDGWIRVAKETDDDDDAYERVYDQLLEYQGYEDIDRETALKEAIAEFGLPKEVIEANPEKLASVGEGDS